MFNFKEEDMNIAEAHMPDIHEPVPSMSDLAVIMDELEQYSINCINWKNFSYKPSARFAIAFSNHEIFIKYYVREQFFKAEMTEPNDNVYEDSCVEFFVSPAADGLYYNFEFNGIGTCLLGSGTGRADNIRADASVIRKIRVFPSMPAIPVPEKKEDTLWNLTVAIPFDVFYRHHITDLKQKSFRVNFYKCGDKLQSPHYLTWSPVLTEKPDFHRPEYFGTLKFI